MTPYVRVLLRVNPDSEAASQLESLSQLQAQHAACADPLTNVRCDGIKVRTPHVQLGLCRYHTCLYLYLRCAVCVARRQVFLDGVVEERTACLVDGYYMACDAAEAAQPDPAGVQRNSEQEGHTEDVTAPVCACEPAKKKHHAQLAAEPQVHARVPGPACLWSCEALQRLFRLVCSRSPGTAGGLVRAVHIHVIGDGALRRVLEAVDSEEASAQADGSGGSRTPPCVDLHLAHLQLVHTDDRDRFVALAKRLAGGLCDGSEPDTLALGPSPLWRSLFGVFSPIWFQDEPARNEQLVSLLGQERFDSQYPWRLLLPENLARDSSRRSAPRSVIAFGSDFPVSSMDPLEGLRTALAVGVPLHTALLAYTSVAAAVVGVEGRSGTLKEGYSADFVLLAGKAESFPWSAGNTTRLSVELCDALRQGQLEVASTYLCGELVYSREQRAEASHSASGQRDPAS